MIDGTKTVYVLKVNYHGERTSFLEGYADVVDRIAATRDMPDIYGIEVHCRVLFPDDADVAIDRGSTAEWIAALLAVKELFTLPEPKHHKATDLGEINPPDPLSPWRK